MRPSNITQSPRLYDLGVTRKTVVVVGPAVACFLFDEIESVVADDFDDRFMNASGP